MGDINLAGYITGYGIVHKDGTVSEHTYDNPIHNKIVKSGINQMLRYNGSNTGGHYLSRNSRYNSSKNVFQVSEIYPMFRGSCVNGRHYGCLHFCQLGLNNEPTNFFDEDIKEPLYSKVSTVKTDSPYTFTNVDDAYNYTITITHTFNEFDADHEIGEIGYFGRYKLDADDDSTIVYPMFSRIALENKILVKEGEQFYCTYKLKIKLDNNSIEIDDFMGIEGQKAVRKYCPYCPTTGNINNVIGQSNISGLNEWYNSYSRMPFPAIDSKGNKYYPISSHRYSDGDLAYARHFCFPQVYYKGYDQYSYTSSQDSYNRVSHSQEFIHISTTNREFRGTGTINQSNYAYNDYKNLEWYNENGTHQFVDYNPNRNYRDIKLIVPKYNPSLNTVNNQKITFYNIYCRGYEYRLGYYNDDGNGTKTWVPQPMTKWVNENWTFTCRTTINTEDTDAWMAGILKPEDYNAEFLTSDNTYITACYWTDMDGKNHINTTNLDQEQPSLNFKFKIKNKFNEKIMTDFVSCNIKLVGETNEIIKSFNFGTNENELVYEQTGCKVYLENYEDILEGKYAVYMQFIDKNGNESEYIKMFDGNKVIRE